MKAATLVCAVLTLVMSGSVVAQTPRDTTVRPITPEALRQVDSIAEAEFRKDSLGSFTVAVVKGPEMVWAKSYGFSDRKRTQRATPATVYRIASVTKQFTAIALMQLVDRKVVRLSDPVDQYVPEIRTVRGLVRPPSLVQLATMTSGLARDPAVRRKFAPGPPDTFMQILVASLPETDAVSEPGVAYRYSNIGYVVLGAAISRAAKTSFVDYVRANIIRPLGMTSTDFVLSSAMQSQLATGVDYDVLVKDSLNYDDAAESHKPGSGGLGIPSGGLYSTVGDLAKLVSLEIGFGPDSVLSKSASALRNAVPVAADPSLGFGYSLGQQVQHWRDTTATGHSGNTSGYTSQIFYSRSRALGVIVLRSAAGGKADASLLGILAFNKLVSFDRRSTP